MKTKKEKQNALMKLREKMRKDNTLPLKKQATNLVFGEGNPNAEIVFIGEGPGYWEDQKARPFVGNAGALLNQLIVSIGMNREDVFITNVVHYRPPQNRDPEADEIKAFQPYLDGIIEIISPKMIVTLGRFSMAKFLPGVMISAIHGKHKIVNWKGKDIIVVAMYHPAAGLRNGEIKRRLFEDFKKIPKILENTDENVTLSKDSSEQMSLV